MATIVSSTVVSDSPQADTRRIIHEQHVDLLGMTYDFYWMALATDIATSQLTAHAATLTTQLSAQEIANNLVKALNQGVPALTYNYCTTAQSIAALQVYWAVLTGWQAAALGNYINSLALSDATLENIFGVTVGAELTALKAVISQCVSAYAAYTASVGAA